MAIRFSCECRQQFETDDDNEWRPLRCPKCRRNLMIPGAGTSGVVAAPAEIAYPSSGRALASLILGALSLVAGVFAGLPAIVQGCRGLGDIKRCRGWMRGRPLAVAGIVLGVFGSAVGTFYVVVPLLLSVREVKREQDCSDNLKQIALAMHNFHGVNGTFPPAAITDREGRPLLSWRVAILPHLGPEGLALYRQFHLKEPWDSPHNRSLLDKMPAVYACPDEPRSTPRMTNYLVTVGPGTPFTGKPKGATIASMVAGTSHTIMITESNRGVPWTAPQEILEDSGADAPQAGSRHPDGYHMVMADGSVRFVPKP